LEEYLLFEPLCKTVITLPRFGRFRKIAATTHLLRLPIGTSSREAVCGRAGQVSSQSSFLIATQLHQDAEVL
jgi:hypothetical protein